MHYLKLFFACLFFVKISASQGKQDSTILKREYLKDGGYEVVFVEKNKNAAYYQALTKRFTVSVKNNELKHLAGSFSIRANHTPLSWLAQKWIPLNRYKGKYYLYMPSDAAESSGLEITDSTVSMFYFDSGVVTSLITRNNITSTLTKMEYVNAMEGRSEMNVYVIDRNREVVVFEYPVYGRKKYQLMVSEKYMRNFPIIVIHNTEGRTDEWVFDKIAYSKLIRQRTLSY